MGIDSAPASTAAPGPEDRSSRPRVGDRGPPSFGHEDLDERIRDEPPIRPPADLLGHDKARGLEHAEMMAHRGRGKPEGRLELGRGERPVPSQELGEKKPAGIAQRAEHREPERHELIPREIRGGGLRIRKTRAAGFTKAIVARADRGGHISIRIETHSYSSAAKR